jgi:hypothetical protein
VDAESGGSLVIATYREIAQHFGLNGPNAARTKAKRAGWEEEPTNHPADTKRIKVPRDAWEGALEAARSPRRESPHSSRVKVPPHVEPSATSHSEARAPSHSDESPTLKALEGALSTLREQLADVRAERDRERVAADHARRAGELDREGWAEERARTSEERLRLQARVDELTAELARLQATPPAARRGILARLLRRGDRR